MKRIFSILKQSAIATTVSVIVSFQMPSAIAGDPFRKTNFRPISDTTESAFEAIFQAGNYQQANRLLKTINSDADPLAYALKGAIAYTEKDWNTLKKTANQPLRQAKEIGETDPLRRDLYLAIGHFLEGSYLYEVEGAFSVFNKLQTVLYYLDLAEKHNPNDPELNLIKGYLDLFLAANLPFFQPENAIARLETHARPAYLVNRGLAIAYRDLETYEKAQTAVEKALKTTPNNPEIHYLKGQILYQLGEEKQSIELVAEAVKHFDSAIARSEQLPDSIRDSYPRERCLAQTLLEELKTAKR